MGQNITLNYTEYKTTISIPKDELKLIEEALSSRKQAYSKYSSYQVGAAVELENGQIISANNQENAAYPSSLCAERTAIYYTGAKYPNEKIKAIAICGGLKDSVQQDPTPPCGACRQALLEYEQKQGSPIKVIFCGTQAQGAIKVDSVSSLLPFNFTAKLL